MRDYGRARGAPNTYRRKLSVAQLRFGDDVVFTARTALWLRQLITANPPVVDVLARPDAHYRARTRTRFHRGATIDGASTVKIERFYAADVYRAMTDAAADVPLESLLRWLPAMDRLRQGTLDGFDEHVRERGRFRGVVNCRAASALLRTDLPHSGAERTGRAALRRSGFPPYPRPYPVRLGTRIIAEIDVAFPRRLYGAEIDGPHHLLPEVAVADKSRDRQLARLGWTIERFSADAVTGDPEWFANEVRKGLIGPDRRHIADSDR